MPYMLQDHLAGLLNLQVFTFADIGGFGFNEAGNM